MTRLAGIVPVLLGLAAVWGATRLALGSLTDPGPGLWPFVIGVLLVCTGVAVLLTKPDDTEAFTRGAAAVIAGAASLALYALVIEHIGFEIPTVVLLAVWLRFLGGESWRSTAIVSVPATVAAHVLFITALGVPLPHLIGV